MTEAHNYKSERLCVFKEGLFDIRNTTARFVVHEPVKRDCVIVHDALWEGDMCCYHNFFFDETWHGVDGSHPDGVYRMYYNASGGKNRPARIAYAESPDGIHFTKPNLGISDYEGSRDNNIVLGREILPGFDNCMVFRDDNPACPPERRYKAVYGTSNPWRLDCLYSPDGIHWETGKTVIMGGHFDSLNVVFWDTAAKKYRCYFRGNHSPVTELPERFKNEQLRDIRYAESEDFEHWTAPEPLDFLGAEDVQMYTNHVFQYFRAPETLIGFPTRYNGRGKWTGNYDRLCGREKRLERMQKQTRFGLALTDCIFMTSNDGFHFHRFESAFMRPGPENGINWVYGDCYPARGLALTESCVPGEPKELSMYVYAGHWLGAPAQLWRYTLRQDGFVSLHADGEREETVMTEPFTFEGTHLYANFSTSARGYLFFRLFDASVSHESTETFGDALDREIGFNPGEIASLAGKKVRMQIKMRDSDLYSFRFGE